MLRPHVHAARPQHHHLLAEAVSHLAHVRLARGNGVHLPVHQRRHQLFELAERQRHIGLRQPVVQQKQVQEKVERRHLLRGHPFAAQIRLLLDAGVLAGHDPVLIAHRSDAGEDAEILPLETLRHDRHLRHRRHVHRSRQHRRQSARSADVIGRSHLQPLGGKESLLQGDDRKGVGSFQRQPEADCFRNTPALCRAATETGRGDTHAQRLLESTLHPAGPYAAAGILPITSCGTASGG